jgi:hypothetical protein
MLIKDKAVLGCSLYTQRSKQSRLDVWPFAIAYASLWLTAVAGEGSSSDKVRRLFLSVVYHLSMRYVSVVCATAL